MPSIIDSFVVTLGFDPAKLQTGKAVAKTGLREIQEEADRTQAALDKALKAGADKGTLQKLSADATKAAGALRAVRGAARGTGGELTDLGGKLVRFLAVLGGAAVVKRFVEDAIASSAALALLSKNLAVNAGEIVAWSNAVQVAGGSAGDLESTLQMLSKAQTDLLLTGESSMVPLFSHLNVAMFDAQGKARSLTDQLLDLSQRFEGMPRNVAFNLGQIYGINPGTLNLLLKGRNEVEALLKKQKEYAAQQARFAPTAAKLNILMIEARLGFQYLGNLLAEKLAPAIEWVFDKLKAVGQWAQENQGFLEKFFMLAAAALTAYYIPAMIRAAIATWLAFAMLLIVTAVGAVSAALALLWDDLQVFKNGGESFFNWKPALDVLGATFKWLHGLLDAFIYRVIAAADAWDALKRGDWQRLKYAAGELWNGRGGAQDAPTAPAGTTPAAQPPAKRGGAKQDLIAQGFANYNASRAQSGTTGPTLPTKTAQEQTIAYFMAQGWTREQATGIAANLKQESNFNPAAVGDGGKAYGIGQWHPDRQANFKKQYGKDMQGSTLEEQLAFLQWELMNTEKAGGDKLRKTTNAQDAAEAVSRHVERPGATPEARDMEAARRRAIAAAMHGIPGASQAAAGAGAQVAATARPAAAPVAGARTVETNIQNMTVNTQATDARGMAAGAADALDFAFTAQANGAAF